LLTLIFGLFLKYRFCQYKMSYSI